ncbi:hypothetical protein BH18THE1_BH18THE1_14840 [soil metagenome]
MRRHDDNNCNERTPKIIQKDNCKAENEYEHIGTVGDTTNNNDFTCINDLESPANCDDNVSNEPGDVVICHVALGNPAQSQTLSLSQFAANSHLANHPFDTTGPCP